MNLYIQIQNGQPINHPSFEENLLQAFGVIPENWEPFVRVDPTKISPYKVLLSQESTYQKIDGVWTDVFPIRDMTAEEKAEKQQASITFFNNREQASNWSAWIFDEETCKMVPPIPRLAPDEEKLSQGIMTFWCGAENNWKDTPTKPTDGQYKFDFFAWQWIEVTNV